MYGYVRPVKGELKVSEFERFRGVYCGLCHELARRYGFAARFLVNYDFTFLAMLLAQPGPAVTCPRRCPAHPLKKTECLSGCDSLAMAADMTVILGWWKLADGGEDKFFPASWGYKAACGILKSAYKKAAGRQPVFAAATEQNLKALQALEKAKCPIVDEAADKFALILRAAGAAVDGEKGRVLSELLYHLGRIIYILDAADDLPDDIRADSYNPLRYRFRPTEEGKLLEEDQRTIRVSLQHSHNALSGAYALLSENIYSGILSNTIYLGLPAATQAVFSGTWKTNGRIQRERSIS